MRQHTLVSGGVRGTLPWMAPELLSGKSNMVTEKVGSPFSRSYHFVLANYILKTYLYTDQFSLEYRSMFTHLGLLCGNYSQEMNHIQICIVLL